MRVYGNHQFDRPFIEVNKKSLPRLNRFKTTDIGLNAHAALAEDLAFHSFSYFAKEDYGTKNSSMNFTADADARKARFFSVNNIDRSIGGRARLRLSTLFDYTDSDFRFGTIASSMYSYQYFASLGGKSFITNRLAAQYGLETSVLKNRYREVVPVYFFALSEKSPSVPNRQDVDFHYAEPYLYLNYDVRANFGVSSSVRKNAFRKKGAEDFLSYQISSHYSFGKNRQNRFVIAGGKYHSYANPTYLNRSYNLLASRQLAIDYYYESENIDLSGAVYYKKDSGSFLMSNYEEYDSVRTFGLEMSADVPLGRSFSLMLSNTYVDQKTHMYRNAHSGPLNLRYFVKAQLVFRNPDLFTCSFFFATRPGNRFTPVRSASFDSAANDFRPVFDSPFTSVYGKYRRLDFSANRLVPLNSCYLIAFLSVNNVLDGANESAVFHNADYSDRFFDHGQKRTLYFGVQARF